ncbi:hypothetical protein DFR52_102615 [Hoeflea marina]|uniref:Uncharacterized protein n=1 Tax=Hoeflea marina TaxID=274592 RepID=A0A317PQU6_9HYPH|nr:hypothetical protein [Hoeflea marina]PWW01950.1 hypothetical protein DFR52_102615 [Hoeflea marina]
MDHTTTMSPGAAATVSCGFLGGPDPSSLPQIAWALGELADALAGLGVRLITTADGGEAVAVSFALGASPAIEQIAALSAVDLPAAPDSFAIFAGADDRMHVYGADIRGLVYAVTELADRARCGRIVPRAADFAVPLVETPAARVRSISRCFQSDVEDLPWFHDREGWRQYLTQLATHRFNRISLTLGMQYNYPYGNEFLSDVYFYFAYPFLVAVPGHDVQVSNFGEDERRRNLESLRFIAAEADRRGLDFQLALWTQSYDFDSCPAANHQITGVGPDNLALYCRDALAMILAEVPEISGLTLRVHVECGIPEGDYRFWKTYFEAVEGAGRTIRLDLHAKGIDEQLIATALATGMPVTVSPKYTSEHLGLPYHQASIRQLELPPAQDTDPDERAGRDLSTLYSGEDADKHAAKWKFSEGSRKFMRYSYGDLMREDRPYGIMFRIWPGTMRILLWGDAALAAGYGRNASFCGADGIELCEPLSFKGRMGTGISGSRTGYQDDTLAGSHDWRKFAYTYRVWGRSLYDPDADPQAFRRHFAALFGAAGGHCEAALGSASRILPLVTLAHTPTASNNSYWPEMYQNMSIVHEAPYLPYGYELFKPARFGTVGACDPQLFLSPAELAMAMHRGYDIRKLSPLTWANWLDRFATEAAVELARARAQVQQPDVDVEFRRLSVDVTILGAIGRFFAAKIRAAVFWELGLLSCESDAADEAIAQYRLAREAWAVAAEVSRDVYLPDITYGPHSWLRGRWDDRLPAIDLDIAEMVRVAAERRPSAHAATGLGRGRIAQIHAWSASQLHPCRHVPPPGFIPGADLELSCAPLGASPHPVILHYRHVNQAEPWQWLEMDPVKGGHAGRIAAAYTASPFPLQYYFEIRDGAGSGFCPGFVDDLSNTPYFVLPGLGRQKAERPNHNNKEQLQ